MAADRTPQEVVSLLQALGFSPVIQVTEGGQSLSITDQQGNTVIFNRSAQYPARQSIGTLR